MPLPDFSEVWTAVGEIIAGDASIVALAPGGVQYSTGRPKSEAFPILRMRLLTDGPNLQLSEPGDFAPRMQIDVFGTDEAVLEQIKSRLDWLLTIPRRRREPVETQGYRIRSMNRTGAVSVETPWLANDGRAVVQLSTDWNLKVTKR